MEEALQVTKSERLGDIDLTKYRAIDVIAAELLTLPQTEFPLIHEFAPGIYMRTRIMPKETMYVTAIHKTENPFVIMKGKVSISHDGSNWTHIDGPYAGVTPIGTQRIIITHEDTIWKTFHANPDGENDINKLEERLASFPELPPELMQNSRVKQLAII